MVICAALNPVESILTVSTSPHPATFPTAAELLEFDVIGTDHFRARHNLDNLAGMTFGGQALGQSLAVATRTVENWHCHSLSGYFIRGGIIDEPIDYAVERVSDSRSFACRRVRASQRGKTIFELLCSFHCGEQSLTHQYIDIGEPPSANTLDTLQQFANRHRSELATPVFNMLSRDYVFEIAPTRVDHFFAPVDEPSFDYWIRTPSAATLSDVRDHHAVLALMSDYWFPGTIGITHPREQVNALMSLNHTLRLHAPVKTDQWLLYRTRSDWADLGRGIAEGSIFDQSGRLVATVSQEALLR